jgi:hypothetical protein
VVRSLRRPKNGFASIAATEPVVVMIPSDETWSLSGTKGRGDVRHVEDGGAPAGKEEGETVAARQSVGGGLRGDVCGEFVAARLVLLVEVFEDELLRAVDGALGKPAGQARFPGEGGVAGGIDEAGRRDADGAVPGGEGDGLDPAARTLHLGDARAQYDPDAQVVDGAIHPAAQGHLVIVDSEGVSAVVVQVTGLVEIGEDAVEDAVGQLAVLRAVAEDSAEQADEGVHHLAAEQRQRVDEYDVATEPGGLDGGRDTGDSGAHDTQVGGEFVGCGAGRLGNGVDLEFGEGVRHQRLRAAR